VRACALSRTHAYVRAFKCNGVPMYKYTRVSRLYERVGACAIFSGALWTNSTLAEVMSLTRHAVSPAGRRPEGGGEGHPGPGGGQGSPGHRRQRRRQADQVTDEPEAGTETRGQGEGEQGFVEGRAAGAETHPEHSCACRTGQWTACSFSHGRHVEPHGHSPPPPPGGATEHCQHAGDAAPPPGGGAGAARRRVAHAAARAASTATRQGAADSAPCRTPPASRTGACEGHQAPEAVQVNGAVATGLWPSTLPDPRSRCLQQGCMSISRVSLARSLTSGLYKGNIHVQ